MKKVLNVKKVIVFLSLIILGINSTVFATSVLETNSTGNFTYEDVSNTLTNEYDGAGTIPVDGNYLANNTVENNITSNNISVGYNTAENENVNNDVENNTDLPQTGIEDYNIGILLVICIAAAIYTYKKMKDYKNI